MFKYLFSPITINTLEVKNRIAYPSLGLLYSYDGKLNDRYYHYFREKARGGAGLITVGPVGIDLLGAGMIPLSLTSDDAIPSFKKLASIIKGEGARAWIQLFHAGAYSHSVFLNGGKPMAPSPVYSPYSKETPREMSLEDIRNTQRAFVAAALRAREAGFDGVEIIGSGGYLITQFLSPVRNVRTDEYGGSFENRVRFPREIIEMLRASLGARFPIGIRMAGNDFVPGSNTDRETPEFARVYERAGVNVINVTGGWHETHVPQLPMEVPRGAYSYLALTIKKVVSVPVIASNRISNPRIAEDLLRDGCADMVNLGRVLIADPHWPRKALEGREREIRPCIACNQGCTDTIFSGKPVFCVTNPCAGFEGERVIERTKHPRRVMVIGAGPGGLEAAVAAARAGHSVELYEKDDGIGGQLWLAGTPPHKQEVWELIRYYRTMIEKLGISLILNTEVQVADITAKKPDFVIVAEGAETLIPSIEGIDDDRVFSSWTILRDNPMLGKSIAVIGGGAVGLETALFLASKGTPRAEVIRFLLANEAESAERVRELMFKGSKEVTVFEMLPKIGKDVGKSTRWVLTMNLRRFGVETITSARVLSVQGGSVLYERDGKRERRRFDNIVIAVGSRSIRKLSALLKESGIAHKAIGDCVRPARINDAIHEGFLAALEIERVAAGA